MKIQTTSDLRVASRWFPTGSLAVNHPDNLGVVYVSVYDANKGSYQAVAYRGTAGKPEFNFSYRNREMLERKVSEWFDSLTARKTYVESCRVEQSKATELKPDQVNYISTTQTASLLRKALKKNFPSVKFSVRSDSYAGGSSIRIDWIDGPTTKQVDRIADQYQGSGFDGSIDLKYSYTRWLMPDGSTIVAHSSGTEGSRGCVPETNNAKPHKDAVLVRFGADFTFWQRHYSEPVIAKAGGPREAWQNLQDVSLPAA
jgi:Large polyvalent protein associated domain 29